MINITLKIATYFILNTICSILGISMVATLFNLNINAIETCIKLFLLLILNKTFEHKLENYTTTVSKKIIQLFYTKVLNGTSIQNLWEKVLNIEKVLQAILINLPRILSFILYYHYVQKGLINIVSISSTLLFIYISTVICKAQNKLHYKISETKNIIKDTITETNNNIDYINLNQCQNIEITKMTKLYGKYKKYDGYNKIVTNGTNTLLFLINVLMNTYLSINNAKLIDYVLVNIYYYCVYKLKNMVFIILEDGVYQSDLNSCAQYNNLLNVKMSNDNNNGITLTDVSFSYNNVNNVLSDTNLQFDNNKINILFGENGCGKTTIIKLILGLLKPNKGTITFGSDPRLQYLSSEPVIFNGSVNDNVLYGANSNNLSYWCSILNLTDWYIKNKDNQVGFNGSNISKGDKKKIQLLHALNKGVNTIIFDEPSTELDNNAIKWLISLVTQLCTLKKTIIIATHDRRLLTMFEHPINIINLN
jgi:ABC-type transport system involved in cytochrome bd biosynthesis fused ATPase/permease subunit